MNLTATTTAGVSNWRLGFALLGGAIAWAGHLLLAYVISEFGCVAGWGHRTDLSVSPVSWLLIALSVAMATLAGAALWLSYGIDRRAAATPAGDDDRATADYVARFGLITNGLFLFIILIQSVPIFFFLRRC